MHCNTLAVRPGFTPLTIALMVLGFIVFWPLGLAMLAYAFWGHRMRGFVEGLKTGIDRGGPGAWSLAGTTSAGPFARRTGNSAFDEYRRAELDRLEAERRRRADGPTTA